jgi:hypothetical protein
MTFQPTAHRSLAPLVVTLLLVSSVVSLAAPAAAAAEPTVSLVPASDEVSVDETTTVDVVVRGAGNGVGAYNATITVDDRTTITDVSVGGDAGLKRVEVAGDGSSARIVAALMDTGEDASRPITIATLTVRGVGDGTSEAGLRVTELVDENGGTYEVAAADGTSMRVADRVVSSADEDGGGAMTMHSASGSSGEAESDGDSPDRAGASDGGGDGNGDGSGATSASSGSDGEGASAGSGDASSAGPASATPGQSDDVGAATQFGTALDTDVLDRAAGAVGGPVGAAVAAVVVLLLGIGLRRRR